MAYTSPSIAPSGTTFAQFQKVGAGGILESLITALTPGTSGPSTTVMPTVAATGGGMTGGGLPAGTYYYVVTETNGIGETTPGKEGSFTIATGNIPQITFASLQPGNLARNVYLGTASGAEVLYAEGITAGTYNLSAAIPANSFAVPAPTVNDTGLTATNSITGVTTNYRLAALRAVERGNLQDVWNNMVQLTSEFNRGEPISFTSVQEKLRIAHTTFAVLAEICGEVGALIDANPGHFKTVPTGIGGRKTVRQWP